MKNNQQQHAQTDSTREQWIDVTVDIDLERHVVRLHEADGGTHEYVSDNVRALAHAANHNRGRAQWCAKYQQLLVPGASNTSGGIAFYKLERAPAAMGT